MPTNQIEPWDLVYTSNYSSESNLRIGMSQLNEYVYTDDWEVILDNPPTTGLCVGDHSFNYVNSLGCSIATVVTIGHNDTIAPNITCMPYTIQLDSNFTANLVLDSLEVTAIDACTGVTLSPGSGKTSYDCFNVNRTYDVFVIATDEVGNKDSCAVRVRVEDDFYSCNLDPIAICKSLILIGDENCEVNANPLDFDNGSYHPTADSISYSVDIAGPYPVGTTNIIFMVSDTSSNTDTCQTSITVLDTIAPTLTCDTLYVLINAAGNGSVLASWLASSDAICDEGLTVSFDSIKVDSTTTLLDCSHLSGERYDFPVYGWDVSGNMSYCTAGLYVYDVILPKLTCNPLSVDIGTDAKYYFTSTDSTDMVAELTDNCPDGLMVKFSPDYVTCGHTGTDVDIEVQVWSDSGMVVSCNSLVTVTGHSWPSPTIYIECARWRRW